MLGFFFPGAEMVMTGAEARRAGDAPQPVAADHGRAERPPADAPVCRARLAPAPD